MLTKTTKPPRMLEVVAAPTLQPRTLFLQIDRRRYQVASYAEASAMFCAARDAYGEGASNTPTALLVYGDGSVVGYVAYNGRVFEGTPQAWTATTKLLFDNRE